VGNFRDVYAALATARAATRVEDGASLAAALIGLMADPIERERLGRQGQACVERLSGALDRTLEALEPYIPVPKHDRAAVPGA
jgi:3-deoxy-D-manno-octulosonic-acid transferase